MAENEQRNPGERRPDIDFGGASSDGGSPRNQDGRMQKPAQYDPHKEAPGQAQAPVNRPRSAQPYPQGTARPAEQYRQNLPPNGMQRQGTRSDMARQYRPGDPQGMRRQAPPQQGKRPPMQNGRPSPQNMPPTRNAAPDRQNIDKKQAKAKNNSYSAGGGAAVKKGKFTKKQALQVTGLILMLILILGLAVFLVFNHYYNLLNHETKDISNSAPMTYSDVDLSRPDTFEKSVEDAKLKELTAKAKKITSDDVMNILLIGEDLRDTTKDSREVGNTDVMMVISVNKKDKTITLTSIMRDCYVSFQDKDGNWWSNRINAAYWHGGIMGMKNTIEDYLSINIDRYVLVNFKVFIDIVDTLGGIDMHVTNEEANGDPDAPRSDKEHRGMQNPLDEQNKYLGNKVKTDYIKKGGDLHLNGNQALAYARLRYIGDADFDRTKRQRKVINEMIKESRKMSLVQMNELAEKVFPQVTTDVTMGELAGLLLEMLDYRNYKVQEMRIPAENTFTNEFIDGMAVLSVDFPANVELLRKKAYGTTEVKVKEKSEDGKALE